MAKRYVTATGKLDGNIIALCNYGCDWSPRFKSQVITDIENGTHEYWVAWDSIPETIVEVVPGRYGKYLRTDKDDTERNNLDDLPDC